MFIIVIAVEFSFETGRSDSAEIWRLCAGFVMKSLFPPRQKQYFEQRKRQQQNMDMVGSDNHDERSGINGQSLKQHRSLDIINLLNLSKNAQECNYLCQKKSKHLTFILHSSFVTAVLLLKSEICMSV